MNKNGERTIALANHLVAKEAALYFDEVLPVDEMISDELLTELGLGVFSGWSHLVYDAIWGLGVGTQEEKFDDYYRLIDLEKELGKTHPIVVAESNRLDYLEKAWRDIYVLPHLMHWLQLKVPCLNIVPVFAYGYPVRPREFPKNFLYSDFPSFYQSESNIFKEYLELEIIGTHLIDGNSLTWEQVLKIRQDGKSMEKLRNFRIFLDTDLKGKSHRQVIDRLNQKLEDYVQVCTKHKLELIASAYSSLLESKTLITTVALSTISLLSGATGIASIMGAGGAVATIAGTILKLTPKVYEYREAKRSHEVAYLFDINKRARKRGLPHP